MKLLIIVENNKIFIHEIWFKKNPNNLNKEIEKNENKKSFHFKDQLFSVIIDLFILRVTYLQH